MVVSELEESLKKAGIALGSFIHDERALQERTLLSLYKIPFALYLLGLREEANKALDSIKDTTMVGPGEFQERDEPAHLSRSETYRASWILSAAFLLRRYDLANQAAIGRFLTFQDTTLGGFYGGRGPQAAGILNTNHTAMAGVACLIMQRPEEATKAGEFLLAQIEAQPNLRDRFLLNMHRDTGLVCDYAQEDRLVNEINRSEGEQLYYYLGGAMVLLCKLAKETGAKRFLAGARTLCDFISRLPQSFASSPFSGTIAWGCAFLGAATADEEPWMTVGEVSRNLFLAQQREDGFWPGVRVPFGAGYLEPSSAITAEYVRELNDVLGCIPSSRQVPEADTPERESTDDSSC